MLVIKVYSVLSDCVVHLESVTYDSDGALTRTTVAALTTSHTPIDEVTTPDGLARVLQRALNQANGYAGDLFDHIIA